MGARLGRMPSAIGWLFLCAGVTISAAAPPADEQLRAWIRDLDADSFAVREGAAEKLAAAGPRAVSFLSECVSSGNAEAAWRASAALVAIESVSSIVEAAESSTDSTQCSETPLATVDSGNPPPAPGPPPETDIAQALAPPPETLPLEAITEPVLIADAYVSPQLAGERGLAEAAPKAEPPHMPVVQPMRQPSRTIAEVPAVRADSGVTFVQYPAARATANAGRENQPRWMNFLNRTRTMLGLPAR